MSFPHAKILSILCLLMFLVSGSVGAAPAIRCFGSDGHVDIRLAVEGRCVPETRCTVESQAGCAPALAAPSCCGPCLDLPTSFTARTVSVKRLPGPPAQAEISAALQALPHPRLVATSAALRHFSPSPLAASSPLRHLKTVVLLN